MTTKKKLRAKVKELRSKLDRADDRTNRWKHKATRLKESTAQLEAQIKKLKKRNRRLQKASRAQEPRLAIAQEPKAESGVPAPVLESPALDPSPADETQPIVGPDAGWTVVQLRAEARSRGLTGLSGKTKAQLLDALG